MLLLLLACPTPDTGPAPSLALDAWLLSGEPGDRVGMSVAFAGDLNGDGLDDLLLGAPEHGGSGAAWVVSGARDHSGGITLSASGTVLTGIHDLDAAGFSVSGAGDTDGDGLDDVIIGGWGEDTLGTDAGHAWLLSGPISGASLSLSQADAVPGNSSYDNAGFSVSGAGDTDGDGLSDVLIGVPFHDDGGSRSGAARLLTASGETLLGGDRAGDQLGHSVSSAGDLNGDGLSDIIAGAWQALHGMKRPGGAYLWLGPVSGALSARSADLTVIGQTHYDRAGISVSSAGDVDGDGLDDVIIGTMVGQSFVLHGGQTGSINLPNADLVLIGAAETLVGASVSTAGDLDGDGRSELLLGAPGWDGGDVGSGGAVIVPGGQVGILDLSSATWIKGSGAAAAAGMSVDGGGDMDGDGWPDLLIGAPGVGPDRAGAAWLLPGVRW